MHQIRRSYLSNRRHTRQHHSRIGTRTSILVTAYDLHPVHERNYIFKFADDAYLTVPGVNTNTCKDEIQHLQTWPADNNLKLNQDKTKEIVIMASRKWAPLPLCLDVERVSRLWVLSVIMNDGLTAADHVTMLLSSSSSLMYAMRVLWAHTRRPRHCMTYFMPQPFLGYTVCIASVVGNVFGCRLHTSWLTTVPWQMARVLHRRRADRCWPIQHSRRLLPPRQNYL